MAFKHFFYFLFYTLYFHFSYSYTTRDGYKYLQETLANGPVGDVAHTFVTVVASSPHISLVVDKDIKLKAG